MILGGTVANTQKNASNLTIGTARVIVVVRKHAKLCYLSNQVCGRCTSHGNRQKLDRTMKLAPNPTTGQEANCAGCNSKCKIDQHSGHAIACGLDQMSEKGQSVMQN